MRAPRQRREGERGFLYTRQMYPSTSSSTCATIEQQNFRATTHSTTLHEASGTTNATSNNQPNNKEQGMTHATRARVAASQLRMPSLSQCSAEKKKLRTLRLS